MEGANESTELRRHPNLYIVCFLNLLVSAWSSIDKEESLACQITSPFNKKIGSFVMQSF